MEFRPARGASRFLAHPVDSKAEPLQGCAGAGRGARSVQLSVFSARANVWMNSTCSPIARPGSGTRREQHEPTGDGEPAAQRKNDDFHYKWEIPLEHEPVLLDYGSLRLVCVRGVSALGRWKNGARGWVGFCGYRKSPGSTSPGNRQGAGCLGFGFRGRDDDFAIGEDEAAGFDSVRIGVVDRDGLRLPPGVFGVALAGLGGGAEVGVDEFQSTR